MVYKNPIIFEKFVGSDSKNILLQKTLLKVLFFVGFKFFS